MIVSDRAAEISDLLSDIRKCTSSLEAAIYEITPEERRLVHTAALKAKRLLILLDPADPIYHQRVT